MEKDVPANRLIKEKSPYLLQHAHNPVDWWPWCEEAFQRAKAEDKPVFLSVGYSTCHWCHVMERESFEDEEVAHVLNRSFVSIKLDREERPDIDSVYMNVTQMLTGSGGWPMSVFMDADKRPFFAGTYFPRDDGRYGIGFISLLERLRALWQGNRERLMGACSDVVSRLVEQDRQKSVDCQSAIREGYRQFHRRFDPRHGGFGRAPKFPSAHNLMFLLRYHHAYGDEQALTMAEKTLRCMYRGGLRDCIGFGFSRYATDEKWLVPHFEKMLYDNALLAAAYTEAFLITKDPFYQRATEEIFQYVRRDMTSPEGGFYSAEDADSDGEEGRFYTFTKREIIALLGEADGENFCRAYGVTESGNFEGRNILNLLENARYEAALRDDFYADCLRKLFAQRQQRVRPLRDEKILAAWNGLMIYSLAYAGRAFGNPQHIDMAKSAADFVLGNMLDCEGKLLTRFRDGEARFPGVADDYAYVIMGLIELYQASFTVKYLEEAHRLNQILLDDFFEDGALYQTGRDSEALIMRPRELHDGALPSYNSVSIANFAKLSQLCDDPGLLRKSEQIVHFFGEDIEAMPSQFGFALCGMTLLIGASRQIVVSGSGSADLISTINGSYQPFTTLCVASDALAKAFPYYGNFAGAGDRAVAYLCEGTHCEAPIHDADSLRARIEARASMPNPDGP